MAPRDCRPAAHLRPTNRCCTVQEATDFSDAVCKLKRKDCSKPNDILKRLPDIPSSGRNGTTSAATRDDRAARTEAAWPIALNFSKGPYEKRTSRTLYG